MVLMTQKPDDLSITGSTEIETSGNARGRIVSFEQFNLAIA